MEPDATWIWIKNLIQQGESEAIEFKGTLPGDEVFARVLSAFANTRGGVLIVGVDEDGTIHGVPSEQVSPGKQRLENVASSLRSGGDVLDILLFYSHKRIEYERSPHRGMGSDPPGTQRTLIEELAPPNCSLAEMTDGERNPTVH